MTNLPRAFYDRDTLEVARCLLGRRLVRMLGGQRLSGLICETEAYRGPDDAASHAYRRTPRSAIMYGPPGYAYVYLIYGMYFCLNAVTESESCPGAVLIRAVIPGEGIPTLRALRGAVRSRSTGLGMHSSKGRIPDHHLTDGPGKLCLAMDVTATLNGADLTTSSELFVEPGLCIAREDIIATPRVGVRGDSDARNRPWRFLWHPAR